MSKRPAVIRRLSRADLVAIVLLAAGVLAVVTGILPGDQAGAIMRRVLPLLGFLATVIVLAELVHAAEVFQVASSWLARRAGGRPSVLFGLCVVLASLTTIVLNLDTTAVLLTPVLLALAVQVELPALPFAMTAVWLANTASLLLPSSNLTNVLASGRAGVSPSRFALEMAAPALTAIAVTAVLLWFCFWRPALRDLPQRGYTVPARRYEVPDLHRPADRPLAWIAVLACGIFLAAVLLELPLAVASAAGAVVVVAAFAVRRRSVLSLGLVPWRLLILVPGIFLVVAAVSVHGLGAVMASLIGSGTAGEVTARAAAAGAVLSNLVNNLPAYLAGEGALPAGGHQAVFGLLIGVNVGPVVTPWASLATLLWLERCRSFGVRVPLPRFMLTGLLLAVTAVAAATAALAVSAPLLG
jgi:Na+/H+ antiporter NhaD/arsenite permease-like protein